MAKAIIVDTGKSRTSTAKTVDYAISGITGEQHSAKITYDKHSAKPLTVDYPVAHISDVIQTAVIKSFLPFYVKFTTIGIEGYGPNNVPPIGIAIVGVNNYIL